MLENIFVTGMPRSGTTLVDRLLSIPGVSKIYSQPLPLLFAEVKRHFLSGSPLENTHYPLSDMVFSNSYNWDNWSQFLATQKIPEALYRRSMRDMNSFSGQYTRPQNMSAILETVKADFLSEMIVCHLRNIDQFSGKIIGLKETWCEEYLPYLVENGFKCVLIVRDPRDIICSLNYGSGTNFGGKLKPLLFNIRCWRKSVAFSLALSSDPRVLTIRYEDLVVKPDKIVDRIFAFADIETPDNFDPNGQIKNSEGQTWHSNSSHSSHDRITTSSVGRYSKLLPTDMSRFIEACCYPEMLALGYDLSIRGSELEGELKRFKDVSLLERPVLQDYVWSPVRLTEELDRLQFLRENSYQEKYFIFAQTFSSLHSSMQTIRQADSH